MVVALRPRGLGAALSPGEMDDNMGLLSSKGNREAWGCGAPSSEYKAMGSSLDGPLWGWKSQGTRIHTQTLRLQSCSESFHNGHLLLTFRFNHLHVFKLVKGN